MGQKMKDRKIANLKRRVAGNSVHSVRDFQRKSKEAVCQSQLTAGHETRNASLSHWRPAS